MRWVLPIALALIATPVDAFDAAQLTKFKVLNTCEKCDLSSANFGVNGVGVGADRSMVMCYYNFLFGNRKIERIIDGSC